jgi:AbrB family looped-hinge helix DNA binding protein
MQAIRTKIGAGGRIIIPASIRNNLHLYQGDSIVLHCENDRIVITTAEKALSSLQHKIRSCLKGKKISMSDQLINIRKLESKNE